MTHEEARENLLADRYVLGRLEAAEAARFEEHFLHCQACLQDLETAEHLARAMKGAASRDALEAGMRLGLWAWLARRGTGLYGIAALLLAVGLVAFTIGRTGVSSTDSTIAPHANVPLLFLSPERGFSPGAAPSHRVGLPAEPGPIVLVLELEPPLLASYRAVLHRVEAPDDPAWRGEGLVPNQFDALSVSLPSSLLSPGDWTLQVEAPPGPEGEDRLVAVFSFRVPG